MRVLIANIIATEGSMHLPTEEGGFEPVCGQGAKETRGRPDGYYEADHGDLPHHWLCGNCRRLLLRGQVDVPNATAARRELLSDRQRATAEAK